MKETGSQYNEAEMGVAFLIFFYFVLFRLVLV